MEDYRMNAIIQAQAGVYTSPCYSKMDAQKRHREWQKFMDALDWNSLLKKQTKDPDNIFKKTGLLVKKKGE